MKISLRALLTIEIACFCACSQPITTINPGHLPPVLPDSVRQFLNGQAPIIGFYAAAAQDSNYYDTIPIPDWATKRAFNALAELWAVKGVPERDTVFDIYALQETSDHDFHSVMVCSTSPEKYQTLIHHYQFVPDSTQHTYHSPLWLNIPAVAHAIDDSLGFAGISQYICAEPLFFFGVSDHVQATFAPSTVTLLYSVGYGDCYSGCISHRYWKFEVSDTGAVRFLGVYGAPPPTQDERRQ